MSLGSIAAGGVRKIAVRSGRKLKKQGPAPAISEERPVHIKNTRDENFTVGFAKRETMPPDVNAKQYWMAGFKSGQLVTGVIDPMTVSAMWIGCGNEGGILMVSADCIGLSRCEVSRVRESLGEFAEKSGCKSINISCTHTHAGIDTLGYWGKTILGPIPGDGKDAEFMEMFLDAIRAVCIEAYQNRREGKLFIGSVHVPEALGGGRQPTVFHDVLTRIRFAPNDGSAETWLLNFAAHPNTMGGDNAEISADYPYYLREEINRVRETNVLFTVGAIASINAGEYCEDRFERTKIQGGVLAKAALSIDNDEPMKPEITVLCQPYYSPVDNGVLSLMGLIKTVNALKFPCDRGDLGLALQTELTYIKIGSRQILLLPGEAKPEVAHGGYAPAETSATGQGAEINPPPLCDIAGDENLLVFGVTNDMTGYIIAPNDFVLHESEPYLSTGRDRNGVRHYHETNSLGYLTAETIADTFSKMMKSLP
ncbi:MAG: hypothetical protein FWF05_09030 [Oscillospiraceae bacterium]|nr:hypothetical protein [Oscillospiraceae bacterium]